jgi:hypothetical protein
MWIRVLKPGREREDCLTVELEIERGALERGTLQAGVRLRTRNGDVIRAVESAPRPFVGSNGVFESRRSGELRDDPDPLRLVVPYEFLDLGPGGRRVLVLTCFARVGGWRAVREREVTLGGGEEAEPEPREETAEVSLEVLVPDPAALGEPYRGGSGAYGLDGNLLRVEAKATGLDAGLHVLRVDLGSAGARFLYARAGPGAGEIRFRGDVPVPCGAFEARLVLGDRAPPALRGEMAAHAWAPSPRELANWRTALDRWKSEHPDSTEFVAGTLAQMAEGYLLHGDYERAEQACRECLTIAPSDEIYRVLAASHLLQGHSAELNDLYEKRLAGKASAGLLWEWARIRALLETDLDPARELWRRGTKLAREEGIEPPPVPVWMER